MSQVTFVAPVDEMTGKFGEKTILRKKKFRAPNGKILFEGPTESYPITNPRDFKKNPPKGAELANINLFGNVSHLAAEIIRSSSYTAEELAAMTPEEHEEVMQLQAQLADFQKRYIAQAKKTDPEAPFDTISDPNSHIKRRKQYKPLRTFIQAILRERLKNTQNTI
mgnify:CR=1 FL=1